MARRLSYDMRKIEESTAPCVDCGLPWPAHLMGPVAGKGARCMLCRHPAPDRLLAGQCSNCERPLTSLAPPLPAGKLFTLLDVNLPRDVYATLTGLVPDHGNALACPRCRLFYVFGEDEPGSQVALTRSATAVPAEAPAAFEDGDDPPVELLGYARGDVTLVLLS